MIEPEQVRAARALLGLSQASLADRSGINRRTLMNFENGTALPIEATLRRIEEVLNLAGVQMIRNYDGGIGVFLSYESLLEGRLKRSAENVERE